MELRNLGPSELRVSAVGLGCNNFGRPNSATEDQRGTDRVIGAALDAGITFFDTADIYGTPSGRSEELMGVALKGRRDQLVLASKFGHSSSRFELAGGAAKGSRAYVRAAVEASLRRLQTDHLDLYQMHTPDPATAIEETIGALDELVTEGKIRAFGHSNFSAGQIDEAAAAASRLGTRAFVSAQNEYSLLAREVEAEVLPAVNRHELGFLPFYPLHSGLLTGKFTRTETPADSRIARSRPQVLDDAPWDVLEAFAEFCRGRGVSMLAGSIGWLLAQPGLSSVIAGATSAEQVQQNAAAAAWRPSADDVAEISAIFS